MRKWIDYGLTLAWIATGMCVLITGNITRIEFACTWVTLIVNKLLVITLMEDCYDD